MILTSTKYHGNLLKDSSWSLLSLVNFFTSLETKKILKIPNRTFLKITRYLLNQLMTSNDFWIPCAAFDVFSGHDITSLVTLNLRCVPPPFHPLPRPLVIPSHDPLIPPFCQPRHPLYLRSQNHAFSHIWNKSVTDGRTDRPSYRDAWTHLKKRQKGQGNTVCVRMQHVVIGIIEPQGLCGSLSECKTHWTLICRLAGQVNKKKMKLKYWWFFFP